MTDSQARSTDGLTPAELDLLHDAESDDVSFDWVLVHLRIRPSPPRWSGVPPSRRELADAFDGLARLVDRDLLHVGRFEQVAGTEPVGGPRPQAMPRYRFVCEAPERARARMGTVILGAERFEDWAFSCWVVSADDGP